MTPSVRRPELPLDPNHLGVEAGLAATRRRVRQPASSRDLVEHRGPARDEPSAVRLRRYARRNCTYDVHRCDNNALDKGWGVPPGG